MKQAIHPDYRPVVFRDRAANFAFLTRSTATSWGSARVSRSAAIGRHLRTQERAARLGSRTARDCRCAPAA